MRYEQQAKRPLPASPTASLESNLRARSPVRHALLTGSYSRCPSVPSRLTGTPPGYQGASSVALACSYGVATVKAWRCSLVGANQVLRNCCSQRAWPAFDSGIVNAGSRAGHCVAIARNPCRRFPDVSCLDHRRQALGKCCRPVASVARLRLGLAPLPVAGVSVDNSSRNRSQPWSTEVGKIN